MGRLFDPAFPLGAVVSGVLSLVAVVGALALAVATRPELPLDLVVQSLAAGLAFGLLWGGTSGAFDRPLGQFRGSSLLAINNLPVLLGMGILWAVFGGGDEGFRVLALIGVAAAGLSNAAALFAWRAHFRRLSIGW